MRGTTRSRLREIVSEIQSLRQQYGAETYRGRRVVSTEDWWSKYRSNDRTNLLDYLPERAIPLVEYHVDECDDGWLEWLVDYRDLMVGKEDKEFADWSTRGLGALVWVDVELRLRFGGDTRKVHEEMTARGAKRVCLVCEFPDIVEIHSTEFGEDRGLIAFCRDHVGTGLPPDLWDVGGRKFKQRERRSFKRLCKECGSPDVVVRMVYEPEPFPDYYCAKEYLGRAVATDPNYRERVRRGEMSNIELVDGSLR